VQYLLQQGLQSRNVDTNGKMVAGLKKRGTKISAEVERALLGMRERKGGRRKDVREYRERREYKREERGDTNAKMVAGLTLKFLLKLNVLFLV
jgi:hypothetical protein